MTADSAVLLPTYYEDEDDYIVLTERAAHLSNHAGHISFPGGKQESRDDSLQETALREADEEIGLDPGDAGIYRELEPAATKTTGYTVQPYAAEIPADYTFTTNDEVADVFSAPISELQANYDTDDGITFYHNDTEIWGVTARILSTFLEDEYGWEP